MGNAKLLCRLYFALPLAGLAVILVEDQIIQILRIVIRFSQSGTSVQKALLNSICRQQKKMCCNLEEANKFISHCAGTHWELSRYGSGIAG